MNVEKKGFPPIADKRSEILILGSLPGDRSILAQEYYANPQNKFWALIGFSESRGQSGYEAKKRYLQEKRIALWDVLDYAEREGALDSKIKKGTPNDFERFFASYPKIERIYLNGQTAKTLFLKHAKTFAEQKPCMLLPSSSPAHTMAFEKKQEVWRAVFDASAFRNIEFKKQGNTK